MGQWAEHVSSVLSVSEAIDVHSISLHGKPSLQTKKKKFEALQRPKEGRWPPDDTKAVQTLSQAVPHESDTTVAPAFDASRLH